MDSEDIAGRVQELCELSSEDAKLTDWEVDFIDSIAKQLEKRGSLSELQQNKVLQLHRKYCGGS